MSNGIQLDSISLVSRNVKIEGEIIGSENIRIEGTIKGLIKIIGDVFVGAAGIVEANIDATNVSIQGKVTGNITAQQKLELHTSAKLLGDFSCRSLDIKAGAIFEGRTHMITTPEVKPSIEINKPPINQPQMVEKAIKK